MLVTADDVYTLHRPSLCRRRVYLATNRPELAAPPSEYDLLLMRLGREHEEAHLATLPEAVKPEYAPSDLEGGAEATRRLIEQGPPVIYQGVLFSATKGLAGIPDFLILDGNRYKIRDAKLAMNLGDHAEIGVQLSLYGEAFADTTGSRPTALEVVLGDDTVADVETVDIGETMSEIAQLKQADEQVDEAVGWSKCAECRFCDHCWAQAEEARDPAVVYGVDQGLRNRLIEMGFRTYDEVLELGLEELAELRRPWGNREKRVGQRTAERVRRQIEVLRRGTYAQFGQPELPPAGPCVFFDLESDPHDEVLGNKVYLWGMLVDRGDGSEGEYWGSLAEPGEEGDRTSWVAFLKQARGVLEELGQVPFVHYSHYEKTWLRKYAERWGDPNGTAAWVSRLLWDMRGKAIQGAFCLPVPSYGLKFVEEHVGFERSQQEYGGLWAVVRYREWLEAEDEGQRGRIRGELLRYNREDCEAMLHVLNWVRDVSTARGSQ